MPAKKLRLQDYLPYRLSVAANSVSRLIARVYDERFQIAIPEWRVLAVLAEEGPMTQQSLCNRTIMDKVTVMRAAQGLLRRRFVLRLPNPDDGRSHRLQLTNQGRQLYDRVSPLALHQEAQLLKGIDPAEVARLHELLRQLQERAGKLAGS